MRFTILILLFLSTMLSAHNVKPAYLEIEELPSHLYAIKWKVPLRSKMKVEIAPHFPLGCEEKGRYGLHNENLIISYWQLFCRDGLMEKNVTIDRLEDSIMDVLVHFKKGDDISYVKRLTSSENYFLIKRQPSQSGTFRAYLPLGVKHILLGFDHLLFVLGLMLIIRRAKRLLLTISSFTLAHSITLGLTILGVVYPSSVFIEALIALSIVILAVEIIYSYRGKYGLFARYPWLIAFLFGLIHGFGFATVLLALGIPQEYLLIALLSFNVGIELGQILFILLLLGLYTLLKNYLSFSKLFLGKVILTYIIGITASYWLIERVYG